MSARQAAAAPQRVTGTSCSMQRSRGQGQGRHLNALLPAAGGCVPARPPARAGEPKPARPRASLSLGTHACTAAAYLLATRRAPPVPRLGELAKARLIQPLSSLCQQLGNHRERRRVLVAFEANSLPTRCSARTTACPPTSSCCCLPQPRGVGRRCEWSWLALQRAREPPGGPASWQLAGQRRGACRPASALARALAHPRSQPRSAQQTPSVRHDCTQPIRVPRGCQACSHRPSGAALSTPSAGHAGRRGVGGGTPRGHSACNDAQATRGQLHSLHVTGTHVGHRGAPGSPGRGQPHPVQQRRPATPGGGLRCWTRQEPGLADRGMRCWRCVASQPGRQPGRHNKWQPVANSVYQWSEVE